MHKFCFSTLQLLHGCSPSVFYARNCFYRAWGKLFNKRSNPFFYLVIKIQERFIEYTESYFADSIAGTAQLERVAYSTWWSTTTPVNPWDHFRCIQADQSGLAVCYDDNTQNTRVMRRKKIQRKSRYLLFMKKSAKLQFILELNS